MNKVISVLGIIALFVVTGCEQVETALEKDVAMSQEVNEESASRAAVLVSVTTYGASWCHFCNVHKRGMGLEDGVKKVFDYGFGKVPMVYIDTEKSDVKAPKIDQCGGIPLTVAEVLFPTRLKKRRVFFCGAAPVGRGEQYQSVFRRALEWSVVELLENEDQNLVDGYNVYFKKQDAGVTTLPKW